jgi:hypothetical protein
MLKVITWQTGFIKLKLSVMEKLNCGGFRIDEGETMFQEGPGLYTLSGLGYEVYYRELVMGN